MYERKESGQQSYSFIVAKALSKILLTDYKMISRGWNSSFAIMMRAIIIMEIGMGMDMWMKRLRKFRLLLYAIHDMDFRTFWALKVISLTTNEHISWNGTDFGSRIPSMYKVVEGCSAVPYRPPVLHCRLYSSIAEHNSRLFPFRYGLRELPWFSLAGVCEFGLLRNNQREFLLFSLLSYPFSCWINITLGRISKIDMLRLRSIHHVS